MVVSIAVPVDGQPCSLEVNQPRPDAIEDLTPYLDWLELEDKAVLTLQCAYRGYISRTELQRLRRTKVEHDATNMEADVLEQVTHARH